MKATIHCGTFKTGSSAIQNTAFLNRHNLLKDGFLYPKAGIALEALQQNGVAGYRHTRLVYEYNADSYPGILRQLDKEIEDSRCDHVILSSEAWSRPRVLPTLKHLIEHLYKNGCDEIQGVIFLRNVKDYMTRLYREHTRRRGSHSIFKDFISLSRYHYDYLTICRNVHNIFDGNVSFLDYDETGDATSLFFDQAGVDMSGFKKPENGNHGLPPLDIEIHRILNEYGLKLKNIPGSQELLNHFGLSPEPFSFVEAFPDKFMNTFTDDYLNSLAEVTGFSEQTCRRLFENKQSKGIKVETVSPILEKALFEWLRTSRQ